MRLISLLTVLLGLSCLCPADIAAQKNIDTQNLLWNRYYLKMRFNENYRLNQELEERTYWFPWRQHQFLSRTFIKRSIGEYWNAGLGFTYFLQSLPHNPELEILNNRTELRPQLEISTRQLITKKISLHHRYWGEFRYIEQPDKSFRYRNNRTRYKLEVRYFLSDQVTLKTFDEIHINIGKNVVRNVFNQNRYGASFQYMPTENLGIELGYFNWFQQRKSGVDFYNRHICRLTVHHRITPIQP